LVEKLVNGPIGFLELREKHRAINDAGEGLETDFIFWNPMKNLKGSMLQLKI
jgi:hypothetical protein